MFSARCTIMVSLLSLILTLSGCGGVTDDLKPSGDDKRPAVEVGTMGTQVGQQSPDFSMLDTLGNSRGLYDELTKATGVVLYLICGVPSVMRMRATCAPRLCLTFRQSVFFWSIT